MTGGRYPAGALASYFGEDAVGALGPGERFAAFVPGVDVGLHRCDQVFDAGEGAARVRLPGDDGEEHLDATRSFLSTRPSPEARRLSDKSLSPTRSTDSTKTMLRRSPPAAPRARTARYAMRCDAIIWTGDDGGDCLVPGLYVCMDISGGGESEAWDHEVAWQSAWRRHHKPHNALPGWVAIEAKLGSSDDLVVFFCGCACSATGLSSPCKPAPGLSASTTADQSGSTMHQPPRSPRLPAHPHHQPHLSTGGGSGSGDDSAEIEYFLSSAPNPDLSSVRLGHSPRRSRRASRC
jgi:hypothetical protein